MIKFRNIKSLLRNPLPLKIRRTDDDVFFERLRRLEYSRLDKLGHTYLDYTGGNLYPESLLHKHFQYLKNAVYGNPHSTNPTSLLSEKFVQEARRKVLDFFNAQDYFCVFTNNASGALQIVGESYPFSTRAHFLLTADNHNSVNGIREYCKKKGAAFTYSPMNCEDLRINELELKRHLDAHPEKENKLFAYPAQSNVSGVRHSLSWIRYAQERGWDVLLDAAAFVPSSKLDLSVHHPDFVSISFYKIFGYPTGIGCLLVRKSKFQKLQKPYYAGGTITVSSVGYDGYFLKQDHEKFENGTINYLDIPAISNGLDFVQSIGIEKINCRVKYLSQILLSLLEKLRHDSSLPLVKLCGPANTVDRGGTFMFNLYDVQEQQYPFQLVEEMANQEMISFRTGCFCNPGIDELNHGISLGLLKNYFVSRDSGDYYDFIRHTHKLRGAVRISIGLATTTRDLEKFFGFLKKFLNKTVPIHEVVTSPKYSNISVAQFFQPFKVGIRSV